MKMLTMLGSGKGPGKNYVFFSVLPKKERASMQIFGLGQTRPVLQGGVDIPFAVFIAHYLNKIDLGPCAQYF